MNQMTMRLAMSFEPPPLLIKRFCAEQKTNEQEARERFDEIKKFLLICAANRGRCYCPSQPIDQMWHAFMVHTRAYARFCDVIGGFVHHEPSDRHDQSSYLNTIASLRELFGAADPEYWDQGSADCSGCGSCSSCGP
jgi:hypothetical protein